MKLRLPSPSAAALAAFALALVAAASAAHATDAPHDFTGEVKTLFRVAACGGGAGAAVPPGYDQAVVDKHCAALAKSTESWRTRWFVKAAPFFTELFAGKAQKTVVYPFGGGDLLSFLAVYPDATEYTTLSLEGMGDPRGVMVLANQKKSLEKRLGTLRTVCLQQLGMAWNTTIQLSANSNATGKDNLPGVLVMTLIALEAHGYEPVSARYFRVNADGSLAYLTDGDIAAADANPDAGAEMRRKKAADENLVQVGPFNDIEITFRKRGDANAPLKTFRHLAADLSDNALAKDPGPIKHLEAKGTVSAMTKAASYLLWLKYFNTVRNYLLAHMDRMVTDDTGIPPRYAGPAGFTQETWGDFEGAYFGNGGQAEMQREMRELWKKTPKRKLGFRFGYPDNAKHTHLLYTYKK
jgi:hypothetical protein